MSKLLRQVRRIPNLESAWRAVLSNGRLSKSEEVRAEIFKFQEEANRNLRSINRLLQKSEFVFKKAKGIPLPKNKKEKNKFRPIVLAPIESRIVQRALLNVLLENRKLKKYFLNPYSFGGIKKKSKNDLAGVPAAIDAVLKAIKSGANHVVCADISKFFTQISKTEVESVVSATTKDAQFISFFREAITVELSNMAELREKASDFPIGDIGVAQGNSLSPLLGNIVLHDFDAAMNKGDCPCIRYIDDFIILAPTKGAARARLEVARKILKKKGMELAPNKTHAEPRSITEGFEFLGIDLKNGLLKPAASARNRFLQSIHLAFSESEKAFIALRNGEKFSRTQSLVATLKRVDGIISGWSKHYYFCNDLNAFESLEEKISRRTRRYLGLYSDIRNGVGESQKVQMFGLTSLTSERDDAFQWQGSEKLSKKTSILIPSKASALADQPIIIPTDIELEL